MKTLYLTLTAALLASSFLAVAARPAHAATDLYLNSFSDSVSDLVGTAPTLDTGTIGVTNKGNVPGTDGNVTTITYPIEFMLTQGIGVSPTNPLFVVEPQNGSGTSTATIQVTLNFQYNSVDYGLVEDVAYYADAGNDEDTLLWEAGTNGTCTGDTTSDSCTYAFTIDGQNFSIKLDNETDWDMAEYDGATEYTGPSTVPEPASLAILGTALAGFGWQRRRKKSRNLRSL